MRRRAFPPRNSMPVAQGLEASCAINGAMPLIAFRRPGSIVIYSPSGTTSGNGSSVHSTNALNLPDLMDRRPVGVILMATVSRQVSIALINGVARGVATKSQSIGLLRLRLPLKPWTRPSLIWKWVRAGTKSFFATAPCTNLRAFNMIQVVLCLAFETLMKSLFSSHPV